MQATQRKLTSLLSVATDGYRMHIALATIAGIVRVLAGLCFVFVSKHLIDIATNEAEGELLPSAITLVGIIIVELTCGIAINRWTELSDVGIRNTLRTHIFGRLLTTRRHGREAYHSGDLLARLTEDVRIVADSVCRKLPTLIIEGVRLVGAFCFLWWFSPVLALMLLLLTPLFFLLARIFFRRIRRHTTRIRSHESRIQEHLQESLQHRILLLTMQQTGSALQKLEQIQQSLYTRIGRKTNFTNYSRTMVMAGFNAGYLAAFLYGVVGLQAGTVSFGLMAAYLQLAAQVQRPIAEMASNIPTLVQAHTALSRLLQLEQQSQEDTYAEVGFTESQSIGVRFTNVSFTYLGKERPAIDGFTHCFAPGSHTAIMGETGAGKSTLLRLILALLTPQKGSVELCSSSKAIIASPATRSKIVYVPQGNTLLSGTIRQNLLMGKPDATDEEMKQALHTAAADFVFSLKNGVNTRCGERGDGLSEGQAQRIAIARGLLKDGQILLLDEISASLDEETETLLMQRLIANYPNRTILIVTHRKQVADYCDDCLHIT